MRALRFVLLYLTLAIPLTCVNVFGGQLDKYKPKPAAPKSEFDRAIERAPEEARKAPSYTPPNPHEGRYQIPKTDYSIGGKVNPPEINVRTTTK